MRERIKQRPKHWKLDDQKADEIRERRAKGEKLMSLALDYDVSESRISRVCSGEAWARREAKEAT